MIFYPPAKHTKEIKQVLKDSINQISTSLKARNKATKHSNEISKKKKKHQKRIASKGNFPLSYISVRGLLVHPLHLTLFNLVNLVISTENCSLYQISFIDKVL